MKCRLCAILCRERGPGPTPPHGAQTAAGPRPGFRGVHPDAATRLPTARAVPALLRGRRRSGLQELVCGEAANALVKELREYQNKVAAAQVGRLCISVAITSLSSTSVRRVARSQPRLPAGSAPTSSRAGPMRRLLSETVNLLRRGRAGEVIAGDFHMRASWKAGQESSMRSGITAQGRSS
jgi:hypothetical protein